MKSREQYITDLKHKLDEWNAEIAQLEAKIDVKKLQARQEYERRMLDLRARVRAGENRLTELRTASENAWQALADGTSTMWDELKKALAETKAAFREGAARR